MSGPILDRIDLHVNVPFVEVEKLRLTSEVNSSDTSEVVRLRVKAARTIQEKRLASEKIYSNTEMKNKQIKIFCRLSEDADRLLLSATDKWQLSARSYFRVIKVSRTIADLAGADLIEYSHVAEALQYRMRQ